MVICAEEGSMVWRFCAAKIYTGRNSLDIKRFCIKSDLRFLCSGRLHSPLGFEEPLLLPANIKFILAFSNLPCLLC